MLSKKRRVSKTLFNKIMLEGRLLQSVSFSFKFIFGSDISESNFAVVVSKKIAPKAVRRNFLRRRIYSALRDIKETETQSKKYSGIFFIKRNALDNNFKDLKEEIISVLKKIQG